MVFRVTLPVGEDPEDADPPGPRQGGPAPHTVP
jgi:hypothetical protein